MPEVLIFLLLFTSAASHVFFVCCLALVSSCRRQSTTLLTVCRAGLLCISSWNDLVLVYARGIGWVLIPVFFFKEVFVRPSLRIYLAFLLHARRVTQRQCCRSLLFLCIFCINAVLSFVTRSLSVCVCVLLGLLVCLRCVDACHRRRRRPPLPASLIYCTAFAMECIVL